MLDCQRRKARAVGTLRELFAEATRGCTAEGIPRPPGTRSADQGRRREADLGYAFRTPNYIDDVRDFMVVGGEVREKTLSILDEVPPTSYEPPYELEDSPGYPFIFDSSILGCEVYFKFQIKGTAKSPHVLFWSCHPPKSKWK